MHIRSLFQALLLVLLCFPAAHAANSVNNEALAGMTSAKVIFDVRLADLDKLAGNLRVFMETQEGIEAQGIKPEMIVTLRGPVVRLLTTAEMDEETLELLLGLRKKGVRFEACAVAMRLFKANPAELVPEIELVANVFHSLIGYQSKDYAMIAIN